MKSILAPLHLLALVGPVLAAAAACGSPSLASQSAPDSSDYRNQPGYIVDSLFDMPEQLRRFQTNIKPVSELAGGAASAEQLVSDFLAAATSADSASLQTMHMSLAEYAYLYFPESPFYRPPYELPPGVLWFQIKAESNAGLTKVMRALRPGLTYTSHSCADAVAEWNGNRIWTDCVVVWHLADGRRESERLFGSIIERNGTFKFVSFANKL